MALPARRQDPPLHCHAPTEAVTDPDRFPPRDLSAAEKLPKFGAHSRVVALLVALALVALAGVLRLPNLATNPGWDADEGYNFNIALNLAHGRHQMFALDFAFVQHPPLFFALVAGMFRLTEPGMAALRLVSIAFALATVAVLPALGRAVSSGATAGYRAGVLAALAYAIWPFTVLQNRFGYSYNMLAFCTVMTLLAMLRYRERPSRGNLMLCGVAATAALCTDQEAVYLLPILGLGLTGATAWRRLTAILLAMAGPATYLSALALTDGQALLFDVTHTAVRVTGGSLVMQAEMWVYNLSDLMRIDPLIPVGLAGLILVRPASSRRLVVGLAAVMCLVILKVRDPNPLFRTAEPLLPMVCLGLGLLGSTVWGSLEAARARPLSGSIRLGLLAAALVIALGAMSATVHDALAAKTLLRTPIDGVLPRSTSQAVSMAAWLNRRVRNSDLVLAMPQVSWLFHARTAELLQAVAITGRPSAFYPAGIPARRWVYDVHLAAARYLVLDRFTDVWIAQNAPERALVLEARHVWRRVYTDGEYRIYENPHPTSDPIAGPSTGPIGDGIALPRDRHDMAGRR